MTPPLLLLLLLGWTVPVPPPNPPSPPAPSNTAAVLREGNRLFQAGDLEGAMAAYAAEYSRAAEYGRAADPLLAYNLGAVAHHLERLPEALLWYRRAAAAGNAGNPWLQDNLELVREQLREQNQAGRLGEDTAAAWSFWMERRHHLVGAGILLAWAALPAVLLPRTARTRRVALTAVVLAASAPFAAGLLLERYGPQDAVLLQSCSGPAGRVPAGSEIRVFSGIRGWRIPGSDLMCPDEAVGLVESPHPRPLSRERERGEG